MRCPFCREILVVPGSSFTPTEPSAGANLPRDDSSQSSSKTPSIDIDDSDSWSDGATPSRELSSELYDFLAPPQAQDELGRMGGYRVLKVLGVGGMGVVFQAEDLKLHRLVALKAMLPALAASRSNHERFLREARAAAAIEHDHIVPIFQVDEDRGVPFIAMPFLRGESLEKRLSRLGILPLQEAVRIARQTAEGLAAAHACNLIHRDIKPANLWLEGEKGRVKILDFGLARSARGESMLTQQGAILGTPAFMAPEQANARKVDCRCDLFSLGCVLYRTVTGELPFKGADTVSTLIAVSTVQPKPPHHLNRDVPLSLSRFIMQLLAKDPSDRPASAQQVVSTLEQLENELGSLIPAVCVERVNVVQEDDRPTLTAASVADRPLSRVPRLTRKRVPRWLWYAAGAVLVGSIVVGLVLFGIFRMVKPTTPPVPEVAYSPRPLPSPEKPKVVQPIEQPPKNPVVMDNKAMDRERAVAEWAIRMGAMVGVKPDDGQPIYSTNDIGSLPKGPFHLHQIFFRANRRLTDEDLKNIHDLSQLNWLMFTETVISDAGLEHLYDLPKLNLVEVQKTRVTEAGIRKLRTAFPRCNVRR
jgi:hypothetical protein